MTGKNWLNQRFPKPDRWPDGCDELFEWFLSARLPDGPFRLSRYIFVDDSDKHYDWIRSEIKIGPTGLYQDSALLEHLRMLHNYLVENRGEQDVIH
jgi:hypothetical protein